MKVAEAVSRTVASHSLNEGEQKIAGPAVHFGFGTIMGAAYGSLAEQAPEVRAGRGTAYGAGLWLAADEVALPALGLTAGPTRHPFKTHAQALAMHLVYGLTLETVRKQVREVLR